MEIFDFAILGTSLSGQGYAHSYVPNLLKALTPGLSVDLRVYNFGVSGGKTTEALTYVGEVIRLRPRAVLIETQMNDCAALTTGQSTTNINSIIDQIQAGSPDTEIVLMTMNKVLGTQATTTRAQLEAFNDIYRSVAPAQGVTLLDLYPLWAAAGSTEIPDELHPTVAAVTAISVPAMNTALRAIIAP